jgi:hypothetical protein
MVLGPLRESDGRLELRHSAIALIEIAERQPEHHACAGLERRGGRRRDRLLSHRAGVGEAAGGGP